jgi:hypothetical protein
VPTNTIPSVPNQIPNGYIVTLKPNTDLTQHLANVKAALANDALCHDPGAATSAIDSQDAIKDDKNGAMYSGNFTDRDVAFIRTTPEFQNIMRDSIVPANATVDSTSDN